MMLLLGICSLTNQTSNEASAQQVRFTKSSPSICRLDPLSRGNKIPAPKPNMDERETELNEESEEVFPRWPLNLACEIASAAYL